MSDGERDDVILLCGVPGAVYGVGYRIGGVHIQSAVKMSALWVVAHSALEPLASPNRQYAISPHLGRHRPL